jgi:hypothetical protein
MSYSDCASAPWKPPMAGGTSGVSQQLLPLAAAQASGPRSQPSRGSTVYLRGNGFTHAAIICSKIHVKVWPSSDTRRSAYVGLGRVRSDRAARTTPTRPRPRTWARTTSSGDRYEILHITGTKRLVRDEPVLNHLPVRYCRDSLHHVRSSLLYTKMQASGNPMPPTIFGSLQLLTNSFNRFVMLIGETSLQ